MIRLGIIGTGRIVGRFMDAASLIDAVQITCVYNPHLKSAEQFAETYHIPCFTDEKELLWDKVDAVYIASPHETHVGYAKEALERRRHVLCEKPMAFSAGEVEELFALAERQNCVLMEAVKTAYCPGFRALIKTARSGVIGEIRDVEAAFTRLTPTNLREMTDAHYGGSLTELGTYVLLPIIKLLGCDYEEVTFRSIPGMNGVDVYTKAFLNYDCGMGTAKTGLGVKSEGQLLISGTKGYILAESPWWLTKKYEVRYEDPNRREVYEYPYEGAGLQYELAEFAARIEGQFDPERKSALTPQESIAIASVLEKFLTRRWDDLRKQKPDGDCLKKVKIWAHRGCSMVLPENTLEAFEAAAKLPDIAGIELDVQLTSDGEVVVFHDENVSRVTDGEKNVAEYSLEELKQLKIMLDEGWTTIPTLREVLELLKPYCEQNGLLINIELKTGVVRYEGIEEKTIRLVEEYGLQSHIVYSSFLADSLRVVKELRPNAKTGMLASSMESVIAGAREVDADALHPWIGGLDADIPEELRGLPVRAWNGEEPFYRDGRVLKAKDLREYAAFGVTDIITNVPERYLCNDERSISMRV